MVQTGCILTVALLLLHQARAQMLISSFESQDDLAKLKTNNVSVSLVEDGVTHGAKALRVEFSKVDWPNVFFGVGKSFESGDWREFGALAVDVTNPEQEPVRMCIRVDDDERADGRRYCRTGVAEVPTGTSRVVMQLPAAVPAGMRAGPPVEVEGRAIHMSVGGVEIDPSHIVAFQIFLPRPDRPHTLILDNVVLLPKPTMKGIVDKYGQYSRADWPGKISTDEDLQAQRVEEEAWLEAHDPPPDRDQYGGWANGPQLRSTGFFRTAYVVGGQEVHPPSPGEAGKGRWWLVTPEGKLFFSLGIDCIRPKSEGPVYGREELFAWLPAADDPLAQFSKPAEKRWADFYGMNLWRKYGEQWPEKWLGVTVQRLLAWGFNTVGNWSDPTVFRTRRVPYTVAIHYGGDVPRFASGWKQMPDVFDPRFPQVVEEAVSKAVAEWHDDPWCLGYFVDNELSWGGWSAAIQERYALPLGVLAHDKPLAARGEMVRLLKEKYGDVVRFNQAWGTDVESWEILEQKGVKPPEKPTEQCVSDLSTLLEHFAQRYFEVVSGAMNKHAPKQLYLGCRFAPRPTEVVTVAARYCDVVSFNIYSDYPDARDWDFTSTLGKPCIIGEFHFGALDRGMFHGGLRPVHDQQARGKAYEQYVRKLWQLKAFVGCHWFQYIDQPLTGRFDGENYNIGFVSIADRPHWELVEAAREVNSRVYEILAKMAEGE